MNENNKYDFVLKWNYDKKRNILSITTKDSNNNGCIFDMNMNSIKDYEIIDNANHYLTSSIYKIKNKKTFYKILKNYLNRKEAL